MLPPAHLLSGYAVLLTLTYVTDITVTPGILFAAGVLAVFPDVDMLWSDSIQGHHNSLLHVPLFWIGVTTILLIAPVPTWLAVLVGTETLFHLFTDYVAGRTTGVMLLYPIRSTNYSLFPVEPEHGELVLVDGIDAIRTYISFYVENRIVIGFEVVMMGLGAAALWFLL